MSVTLTALLILLALLNYPFYSGAIFVNSSEQLQRYLCNNNNHGDLLLELKSESNYSLKHTSVACLVSSGNSIILKSNTSAVIKCGDEGKTTQTLAFFNSTVRIERIVFENCGTNLSNIPDDHVFEYLNSSSLYYTSSHAAALVFVHCKVIMNEVALYHSHGFAIVGVNLHNSVLWNVNTSNSSETQSEAANNITVGSGLMLHFMDNYMMDYDDISNSNVSLINCNFEYNFHIKFIDECSPNNYMSPHNDYLPVTNSAGLTILYTQTNYTAQVQSNYATFKQNVGDIAGAMLIVHYIKEKHLMNSGSTIIENTRFERNTNVAPCHGAGLAFYWFDPHVITPSHNKVQHLIVRDSVFKNHYPLLKDTNIMNRKFSTGTVYIGLVTSSTMTILFERSNFTNNVAPYTGHGTGACIFAEKYKSNSPGGEVVITLEDITASKNREDIKYKIISMVGIFSFYAIENVTIRGNQSLFHDNSGSVIHAVDSDIHLYGQVFFQRNQAMNGAAIRTTGQSRVYFEKGVVARFESNTAQQSGGALHLYKQTLPFEKECVLQISDGIDVTFSRNIAGSSGNSIYAYPIYNCFVSSNKREQQPIDWTEYLHFNNSCNNSLLQVSTRASHLKACNNSEKWQNGLHLTTYPGQSYQSYFAAVDDGNHTVWSTLDTRIIINSTKGYNLVPKLWLQHKVDFALNENKFSRCTPVDLSILSNSDTRVIDALIALSLPHHPGILSIAISIFPCPIGFQLNKKKGVCECSPVLHHLSSIYPHSRFKCNIQNSTKRGVNSQNNTITRPNEGNPWIGNLTVDNVTTFGVSLECPLGYCSFNSKPNVFHIINHTKGIDLIDSSGHSTPLCLFNREKTLCGRCPPNLSVILGSTECRHCHSGYAILTALLYIVAGPLLVYLLYALRFTLTSGTLNGIIFFAQAANAGYIDLLSLYLQNKVVEWRVTRFSIIVLSFFNLDIGFPLCFYNGMTELWKAGLSLLFPLYLLTIVIVLIILSRFSHRLSNRIAHSSVQVLVTVVHLSFSKLVLKTVAVFQHATIYTENPVTPFLVWYYDGTIKYSSQPHLILMIITSLITIAFVLPYILLLVLVKPLRRSALASKYLRPVIEAIHAPYKEGKQHWFVGRLLLLIIMYIVYLIYWPTHTTKICLILSPLLATFLILQAYVKPFKSKWLNILDCWVMYILLFLFLTTWYYEEQGEFSVSSVIIEVSVILFLITFLVILMYHICWVSHLVSCMEQKLLKSKRQRRSNQNISYHNKSRHMLLSETSNSFYGSCNYRESLLSSTSSA